MDAASERVDSLVGGRYEILGLIAAGGMGDVFEARDTVLGRTVALKVLRAASGAEFAARFRTEATNAARLAHPSIVSVYDFGEDHGGAYMAMEHVAGQTLREVMTARGPLQPGTAARIAIQVCAALEHARRAGIVHRDVKPENILVTPDGQVKVADFGLARALADATVTQAGSLLGTPSYLAPEQVEGRPAEHRSDLYALGIVLFEMLTGRAPFSGDTPTAVAYRRLSEDVPAPGMVNPSVPPALDDVVRRACARNPEDRFSTAAEMAQALRAIPGAEDGALGGLARHTVAIPLRAQETVRLERRPRTRARARRRRRFVAMAAVLTLVLIAAGTPTLVGALSKVKVPAVTGLEKDAAVRTIRDAGLRSTLDFVNDDRIAEGAVIRTAPAPGVSVRKGTQVTVVVSLGPRTVNLVDVRGAAFADAERTLTDLGLKVKRLDEFNADVPKDQVFAQEPGPNELAHTGTVVTLYVSKGVEMLAVPTVTGRTEQDAQAALTAAGFTMSVSSRRFDDTLPSGSLISQTPAAGAKAARGSAVAVVISKGPTLVAVPNLRCMTRKQADDALAAKGLKIRYEGAGKRVVDQDPAPGAQAPRGSGVTAFLGAGVYC